MRNFRIITLGCKLNIYESESISFDLQTNGYIESDQPDKADIFIINTCTVTVKADSKCRNVIRKTRNSNPESLVIVCGCLVNTDIEKLQEMTEVDVFVENKNKDMIGHILENHEKKTKPLIYKNDLDGTFNFRTPDMKAHSRAFVKVQDGCDNSCSYCKIPSARGKGRSRNVDKIYSEIDSIIQNGFREIVLTGINIGSYSFEMTDFNKLLSGLSRTYPETRFRISSLELQYIDNDFLDVFKEANFCPHLHIPLQSGSDKILTSMNRNYKTGEFLDKLNAVRKVKNDPFLSTDLILGFPGELDEDFNDTVSFLDKAHFSYIHIFGFSPRKGTSAFSMLPKIPERIRDGRIDIIKKMTDASNLAYRKIFVGKKLEVIIEKRTGVHYTGKSENYLDICIHSAGILEAKRKYDVLFDSIVNDINIGRVVES